MKSSPRFGLVDTQEVGQIAVQSFNNKVEVKSKNCCSYWDCVPAKVTKHTYEIMDDFENSNHGKRVRWACAGGGERMAEASFDWCPDVVIFVRWVGCCSSEAN